MPKTSENGSGRVTLSALDFLGLARERKVARIDLSTVGYHGIIYVRDLTAAEQAKITSVGGGKASKARFYKDKSYEMDLAALTEAAGPKFLAAAVVTDSQDGAILERAFEAADPEAEYITVAEDVLVQMSDTWIRETGSRHKMEEMLGKMGNAITNEVVRVVREISGMVDNQIEEKKENS